MNRSNFFPFKFLIYFQLLPFMILKNQNLMFINYIILWSIEIFHIHLYATGLSTGLPNTSHCLIEKAAVQHGIYITSFFCVLKNMLAVRIFLFMLNFEVAMRLITAFNHRRLVREGYTSKNFLHAGNLKNMENVLLKSLDSFPLGFIITIQRYCCSCGLLDSCNCISFSLVSIPCLLSHRLYPVMTCGKRSHLPAQVLTWLSHRQLGLLVKLC